MKSKTITISILALSLILFLALNIRQPIKIEGDGVFYYSWLHSAWFDHDLSFYNQLGHFANYDKYSRQFIQQNTVTPTGLVPNSYAIGSAIMWLPFFILAHSITWLGQQLKLFNFELDGFSYFYNFFINFSALAFGLLAFYLNYLSLNKFFSKKISFLTIASISLATPWLYYQFFEPFMSHGTSLFLVSSFWYLIIKLWTKEKTNYYLLALIIFLMILTRWQNLIFCLALIPIIFVDVRDRQFPVLKIHLLTFLIPLVAVATTQALIWKFLYGSYFLIPQGSKFIGQSFHGWQTLFSTDRGLLLWSPIIFLALIGSYWLWRKSKFILIVTLAVFIGQWLLNSSLADLGGGEAFGARKFIETLPWLAFGLAAMLDKFKNHRFIIKTGLIILIFWNLLLIQNYRLGHLPRSKTFNLSSVKLQLH